MVKKRTPQQQSEDKSRGVFSAFLSPWIVNSLANDFGIDFEIRITKEIKGEKNQEVSGLSFYAQLKSSDDDQDLNEMYFDLDTDDILLYSQINIPVLLVLYHKKSNSFAYVIVQTYLWDVLETQNPNWKNQKTNRIWLRKKIEKFSDLEKDVIESQIRIIRKSNYNLGLGEGISQSDYDHFREIDLSEFKFKTIIKGFSKIHEGDVESGLKLLEEAYAVKRDDLLTLNTCFNLIMQLNPFIPENHKKIIQYSTDGERIASNIELSGFISLFKIAKLQIFLIQNITSLSQILLVKKISELQNEDYLSLFIQEDVLLLYNIQQKIILEIRVLLNQLISEKNNFEFIISLTILLGCITYQVQKLGFVREDFIKIEREHRRPFISIYENIANNLSDKQLGQLAFYNLGNYYFSICDYEKAETYIKRSLALANELGYLGAIEDLNLLLDDIVQQTNPYDPKNRIQEKEIEEKSFSEIRQLLIKQMELQGFDLSRNDDREIALINFAISDSDPTKYLRYCENIRICYFSTSIFGKMIGLPALGQKVVWCKKGKISISGASLDTVFNAFLKKNCDGCSEILPRGEEWTCTVREFENLLRDPEFQAFLKKFYEKYTSRE